jgi:hypothetical protein
MHFQPGSSGRSIDARPPLFERVPAKIKRLIIKFYLKIGNPGLPIRLCYIDFDRYEIDLFINDLAYNPSTGALFGIGYSTADWNNSVLYSIDTSTALVQKER